MVKSSANITSRQDRFRANQRNDSRTALGLGAVGVGAATFAASARPASAEIINYGSFSELMPAGFTPQYANNFGNPVFMEDGSPVVGDGYHFGFFSPSGAGVEVSGYLEQSFAGAGFPEYLEGNFNHDLIGAGNTPSFSMVVNDTNQNGVILKYDTLTGSLSVDSGDTSWLDNAIEYNGIVGASGGMTAMPGTPGGSLNIPITNLVSVPEPTTLALMATMGVALLGRKAKGLVGKLKR
jgi:hypothetical protein